MNQTTYTALPIEHKDGIYYVVVSDEILKQGELFYSETYDKICIVDKVGEKFIRDCIDSLGDIKYWINEKVRVGLLNNMAYQLLQSRGYDLPCWYLNGQTLFEAGVCCYE